ncbi:zinc-dependent metalloprotease [Schaalia suimastitidis]|uniref:zinc-dependent metalloprotease n=1 Tax=Schaalia suimastitidis TaxID=121163 RepID=UPI00040F9330|nr:zinc-dependent metalloprotease [Schaalia suimastitidis]
MNSQTPGTGDNPDDNDAALEAFFRGLLGEEAGAEAARAMKASGIDPSVVNEVIGSPSHMQAALGQFKYLLDTSTSPVNWKMARDIAVQKAYTAGDPAPTASQAERARNAMSVADLWIDAVTDFVPGQVERTICSRVQWIDATIPMWQRICEPVATNVSRALVDTLASHMGGADDQDDDGAMLPQEVRSLLGQSKQMMPRLASMMFAAQVGEALASLATDSVGSTDVGVPLAGSGVSVLVPHNVDSFADGLDIPFEEVQQYLAVRECAHQRLFHAVPWLAGDLIRAVETYSAHIAIDTEEIAASVASVDMSDPQSMEQALAGGVFASEPTVEQAKALERLETLLALVEGWVEVVSFRAAAPYLPHIEQLSEMLRRRRATGAPAEQVLGRLIGLHMRPRRARGAAELFRIVEAEEGRAGRDALWDHPHMTPASSDLDMPEAFLVMRQAAREQDADIDQALTALLDGTMGYAEGMDPEVDK